MDPRSVRSCGHPGQHKRDHLPIRVTRSVRHVTLTTKRQVFTEYGISYAKHRDYEVDHLIPLELGGSNDVGNLWPEPYQAATGARAKDEVETRCMRSSVTSAARLSSRQLLIANDWTTAVQTITATPGTIPGPSPPTSKTTPKPTSGQPSGHIDVDDLHRSTAMVGTNLGFVFVTST